MWARKDAFITTPDLHGNIPSMALFSIELALTAIGPDEDTATYATHYAMNNFSIQGNKYQCNKKNRR